jgi:orotate phosphoribosyltransferase-like protein
MRPLTRVLIARVHEMQREGKTRPQIALELDIKLAAVDYYLASGRRQERKRRRELGEHEKIKPRDVPTERQTTGGSIVERATAILRRLGYTDKYIAWMSLDERMTEANRVLWEQGMPQMGNKESWLWPTGDKP